MFRFLKSLLFIIFCFLSTVYAQSGVAPNFKYGKISPDEFNTKITGPDSAAAAIKLFDIGEGHFEINEKGDRFTYVFQRHVRYKIVNKTSYDLANFELKLYAPSMSSQEKVNYIRAATYTLAGNKIETSKMVEEAKFTSRLDKDYIVKKFTLPNIKEGSIIEYTYETTSDFVFELDTWYFQSEYPCKYSSFTLNLPEYYHYKIATGGYIKINRSLPRETKMKFVYHSTTTQSAETEEANTVETQYYAENIPAIKNENYITTLRDYVSKIGFELTLTDVPGNMRRDYSSTWPQVAGKLMELDHFGGFIKRKNTDKELLNKIINTEKDPELRMNLIYSYIKNNIKWNGDLSYFSTASGQKEVLEKKSGNSSDINLCLLALLKQAGIESYPVLISTRGNGAHPGYPLLSKFNNVIVQAVVGDKRILLDATDKNNINGLISYQNLNHQGLIINPSSVEASWINIEYGPVSRTSVMYNVQLKEDNTFSGTLVSLCDNYAGLNKRNTYLQNAGEAQFLKNYEGHKNGLEISNYKINNQDQPELPLTESMDVMIKDNVEETGNLTYFTPLLSERTTINPFVLEERNFPVDFAYPREENYKIILDFPTGYHLEKLPKSERIDLPEGSGSFSIIYSAEGNKIAVKSKISILKPVFNADEYTMLKEFYKNIIRKQAEQIVFKKTAK